MISLISALRGFFSPFRRCWVLAFPAGMILFACRWASASIIQANSTSRADVGAAVALAADGDTVVVPAGTASWAAVLIITKNITLQGQSTVSGDHTTTMTANDQTTIQDNVPRGLASNSALIRFQTVGNQYLARITGFTFQHGFITELNTNG